jgi:hypothetical protein
MSARHRQHKRKLWAAQQELAEREVDLVSYVRAINDQQGQELPAQTHADLVAARDATARDCARLRAIIKDLESTVPA